MLGRWLFAMFWVCAVSLGGAAAGGCSHGDAASSGGGATAHTDDRLYICPMHCVQPGHTEPYSQHGPGQCPVCGMNLVVRPEEQTAPPSGGSGH